MTRRARSGNTQKHKKMPEDPTPWSEFSKQMKSKNLPEKKVLQGEGHPPKFNDCLGKEKHNKRACNSDLAIVEKKRKAKDELKLPKRSHENEQNMFLYNTKNKVTSGSEDNIFENAKHTINIKSKYSFETKSSTFDSQLVDSADNFDNIRLDQLNEENLKCIKKSSEQSMKVDSSKTSNTTNIKQHLSRGKYRKNPLFFERFKRNCQDNEIPLHTKYSLHNNKRLRQNGMGGKTIKQINRQVGRKEEQCLQHRTSKICFNCRKPGHILSECPDANNHEQGTGICFKCGSTEHISSKCSLRIAGFPFATCFICKVQGHITRDCPQNKHGIYPKGGKCDICGNVNHLKKECPTIQKAKIEDEVTAHTITEVLGSIDAEFMERKTDEKRKEFKTKKKIVKFN